MADIAASSMEKGIGKLSFNFVRVCCIHSKWHEFTFPLDMGKIVGEAGLFIFGRATNLVETFLRSKQWRRQEELTSLYFPKTIMAILTLFRMRLWRAIIACVLMRHSIKKLSGER